MKDPSYPEVKIPPLPVADDESNNALGGLQDPDIPLPTDISSRKTPTPPRTTSEAAFELPAEIEEQRGGRCRKAGFRT